MRQPGFVYIGRGNSSRQLAKSIWHNPFPVAGDRAAAIRQFRNYLFHNELLLAQLSTLRGAKLGCHCAPQEPCHADVIIQAHHARCLPPTAVTPPASPATRGPAEPRTFANIHNTFDGKPVVDQDGSTEAGRAGLHAMQQGMSELTPQQRQHVQAHGLPPIGVQKQWRQLREAAPTTPAATTATAPGHATRPDPPPILRPSSLGMPAAADRQRLSKQASEAFAPFHALKAADRKRPHGTHVQWVDSDKAPSVAAAIAAGYQRRRGLVPPLIMQELEPGEAIQAMVHNKHPFGRQPPVDQPLLCLLYTSPSPRDGLLSRMPSSA